MHSPTDLLPFLVGTASTVSTFAGGIFALRHRDRLYLILSFSAGAVLGVTFFDLLPEAAALAKNAPVPTPVLAGFGFIAYMILACAVGIHRDPRHEGDLGAASLCAHSVLDGVAIGFAFQVGAAVGVPVALAIVAHDFSDGINTVGVVLRTKAGRQRAFRWLVLDALAPLVGVSLTRLASIPGELLGALLSVLGGFFLYIGAVELLPESRQDRAPGASLGLTLAGAALMYAVVTLWTP